MIILIHLQLMMLCLPELQTYLQLYILEWMPHYFFPFKEDGFKIENIILSKPCPISKELKEAVEKDICKQLGVKGLIFPTKEELEKTLRGKE